MKRGARIVHGDKLLEEKLGRNDLCPCDSGKRWAVVEANAAWGSGIYGCDPDVVLDVIRHATFVQAQPGDS